MIQPERLKLLRKKLRCIFRVIRYIFQTFPSFCDFCISTCLLIVIVITMNVNSAHKATVMVMAAEYTDTSTDTIPSEEPVTSIIESAESTSPETVYVETTSAATETTKPETAEPKTTEPEKVEPIVSNSGSLGLPRTQTGFKSWMPKSAITSRGSAAYALKSHYSTDSQGLCRVGEYYCVAVGTYYSNSVGDLFRITLSSGITFDIIVADIKADQHTDGNHQYTRSNGCMTEFIVNTRSGGWRSNPARTSGNISSAGFQGTITSIVPLGHFDF